MNIKWMILGALAYHWLLQQKKQQTGEKPITQEEIVAAANQQAQEALKQARDILSSI